MEKKRSVIFIFLFTFLIATYCNAEVELKKEYYPDGQIKAETPYKNGNKEGIEKHYYKNGALWKEMPYKNDKLDGVAKQYFITGKINLEIPYKNGKEEGIMKMYYESGQLMVEMPYKEGKKHGIAKHYYENGLLQKEEIYKEGVIQINLTETPRPSKFEFDVYKYYLSTLNVPETIKKFSVTAKRLNEIVTKIKSFQTLLHDTGKRVFIEDMSWEEFDKIITDIMPTSSPTPK